MTDKYGGRWVKCSVPGQSRYRIVHQDFHGTRLPVIYFDPCGVFSFHPRDINEGFCAVCKQWINKAEMSDGDRGLHQTSGGSQGNLGL